MNKVINKFGAMVGTPVSDAANEILADFEDSIRTLAKTHDLTPYEIRCLESCMQSTIFAELILAKATQIKKEESKPSVVFTDEVGATATPIKKGSIVKYGVGHMRVTALFKDFVNLGPIFHNKTTIKKVHIGEVREDSAGFHEVWSQSESYKSM